MIKNTLLLATLLASTANAAEYTIEVRDLDAQTRSIWESCEMAFFSSVPGTRESNYLYAACDDVPLVIPQKMSQWSDDSGWYDEVRFTYSVSSVFERHNCNLLLFVAEVPNTPGTVHLECFQRTTKK